jgi:hypothetical protein
MVTWRAAGVKPVVGVTVIQSVGSPVCPAFTMLMENGVKMLVEVTPKLADADPWKNRSAGAFKNDTMAPDTR